jgi:hypothetical protein
MGDCHAESLLGARHSPGNGVGFHEDRSRIRIDSAAESFARLCRTLLNPVNQSKIVRAVVYANGRKAGWDEDYSLESPPE